MKLQIRKQMKLGFSTVNQCPQVKNHKQSATKLRIYSHAETHHLSSL